MTLHGMDVQASSETNTPIDIKTDRRTKNNIQIEGKRERERVCVFCVDEQTK
jgi:hypothetical protein